MSTTITVWCKLDSENEGDPFPIEIDESKTIGILKDKIKEKKPIALDKVDSNNLKIFLDVDGMAQSTTALSVKAKISSYVNENDVEKKTFRVVLPDVTKPAVTNPSQVSEEIVNLLFQKFALNKDSQNRQKQLFTNLAQISDCFGEDNQTHYSVSNIKMNDMFLENLNFIRSDWQLTKGEQDLSTLCSDSAVDTRYITGDSFNVKEFLTDALNRPEWIVGLSLIVSEKDTTFCSTSAVRDIFAGEKIIRATMGDYLVMAHPMREALMKKRMADPKQKREANPPQTRSQKSESMKNEDLKHELIKISDFDLHVIPECVLIMIEHQSGDKNLTQAIGQLYLTMHTQIRARKFKLPVYGIAFGEKKRNDKAWKMKVIKFATDTNNFCAIENGEYPLTVENFLLVVDAIYREQ